MKKKKHIIQKIVITVKKNGPQHAINTQFSGPWSLPEALGALEIAKDTAKQGFPSASELHELKDS